MRKSFTIRNRNVVVSKLTYAYNDVILVSGIHENIDDLIVVVSKKDQKKKIYHFSKNSKLDEPIGTSIGMFSKTKNQAEKNRTTFTKIRKTFGNIV